MPSCITSPAHAARVRDVSRFEGRSCLTLPRTASCRARGRPSPVQIAALAFARMRMSGVARPRRAPPTSMPLARPSVESVFF
jgi:hypothetical protein